MLYQNLRLIGPGLLVRSTSNSLDLLFSSLLFFLPSFLFSSHVSFLLAPHLYVFLALLFLKNSLTHLIFLPPFFSFLPSFLLAPHLYVFLALTFSSKPSSTSLKTWESGEVGVLGDPMSPTMFFFYFFYFIFLFFLFFIFDFFFNVLLNSKFKKTIKNNKIII